MTEREKVIMGLECMVYANIPCDKCPYGGIRGLGCKIQRLNDALALLREQEKPDCEHAEHDGVGCLGYAKCLWDDEPIDVCKTCRKYTGNRYEEVSGDD